VVATAHSGTDRADIFQVGQIYKLWMMEKGREVTYWDCTVLAVEMPVVKFNQAGVRELIVNVSSPAFISAELTASP
jgi:hypothetical protein